MKNIVVDGHEAHDIDAQVSKIIRGLGNPEPPLSLDDLRELLKLDRQFYSSTDQSFVSEVVSRVKVAGKQILKRPTLLIDAIKKAGLSALWIPDKKRILLDKELPQLKHRWNEAHEIGHSIIPWHKEFLHGDNKASLHPDCHQQIEAEANFAAGRLLFLQDRFLCEARDTKVSLKAAIDLKKKFGNTYSSTLWRYVESLGDSTPLLGVICDHPNRPSKEFNLDCPCRHFIRSLKFAQMFSTVSERKVFSGIDSYCGYQRGGPLGDGQVVLKDDNGVRHVFHFESWSNSYDVLTLGRYLHPVRATVAV